MKSMSKLVALLSLTCFILTALWVGLLIADRASAGEMETFEQVAAHASQLNGLFFATYLNAAILTLAVITFFGALHAWFRSTAQVWTAVGLIFVPIYGMFNLAVYLSQVMLFPALVSLRLDPQITSTAEVLLRLTLQAWPPSITAFFNGLAYAILGIPSILYGLLLRRRGGSLGWGGLVLALNSAACILGMVGSLTGNVLLSQGIIIGGILFLVAMFQLFCGFWIETRKEGVE